MFDFRKEMSIWEILYYFIIGLIGFIFESILRFIDDFFLKLSFKIEKYNSSDNLSLIILCALLTNVVIAIISITTYFMGKNPYPWFDEPLKYGIISTWLYIHIILELIYRYISEK